MEDKASDKEELKETLENVETDDIKSDFLKKVSLGMAPSILSGISASYTKSAIDIAGLRSGMLKAVELGIKPSQIAGLAGLSASYTKSAIDIAGLRSGMLKAVELGIKPSLFDGMINAYQSTILDSGLINVDFTLSESLKIVDEFANEIQDEVDTFDHTDSVTYSEEEIQFITQSLENWLKGSINLKDTLQKIKGNIWALALVTTIVISAFTHAVNILLIFDDYQIQQDRKTMESIETYLETNVLTYKLYKNISNVEKLHTIYPMGFTRTDTYLRNGRAKTAPVITDGFVGQKTLVLMLDRKNNWRKVEVKINGTYLQGWVPESTIIRLKKYD
ncbi:hypothetical protein QWY16_09560 [Planococcus shenhongbingii]|uniref:hypothetical protein n=1 Tax=Planococcus shenhongbingii TaxID=3058398 RepID=UPI00263003F8|nr:hypothetical protein [Planococcus sp. N016]WKA60329.1 hypothetical protein QWY16_09560 [Planococcus sp. N016]